MTRLANCKFGVYLPTHNNPVYLRHCLLQVLNQDVLPDYLAIFENGHSRSYEWAIGDVLESLKQAGVTCMHGHTGLKVMQPEFCRIPLERLFNEAGCDLFAMLASDDIIYSGHFASMVASIQEFGDRVRWTGNLSSQLLVLPREGNYKYNPRVNFAKWNPTGAQPNTIIFDRAVAWDYLGELNRSSNQPDDVVLSRVLARFPGKILDNKPQVCYVCHGKNTSTAHWADNPPPEVVE
jgi:hypothetical protein